MRERLAVEFLLWRITWKLRHRIAWRRRREIRDELRQQLHDSAAVHGMPKAMQRLGKPSQIANEYLAAEPEHPRSLDVWGAAVAGWVTLLSAVLLNGRRVYTMNGVGERWDFDPWQYVFPAPNGKLELFRLFGDLEQNLVFAIQVDQLAYVLLPLVAFAVFLRPWRRLRGSGESPRTLRAMG